MNTPASINSRAKPSPGRSHFPAPLDGLSVFAAGFSGEAEGASGAPPMGAALFSG